MLKKVREDVTSDARGGPVLVKVVLIHLQA
jgi:hypothetical protein